MGLLGWVADNWFGQDPGGGDIKDAAASGMTYMKEKYGEAEDILTDYYNEILNQVDQQVTSMVNYYDQGLQQGLSAYDSMNQAAQTTYQEAAQRSGQALTQGAKLAQESMQKYFQQGMQGIEEVGAAPTFGEYDKTAYRNDPEYQRRKDDILRNVKEFAAFSGAEGMTDDLMGIAQNEITQLDNEFEDRYFGRKQQMFQNRMGTYQQDLGRAERMAQANIGMGRDMGGLQMQEGMGRANIEQGLGQQIGGAQQQAGLTRYGAYTDAAMRKAGAAELGGAGRIAAAGTQGTNIANMRRELGAAGSDVTIQSQLAATEAERQHDAAANELFGTVLAYKYGG